jgi:hypothetical protein
VLDITREVSSIAIYNVPFFFFGFCLTRFLAWHFSTLFPIMSITVYAAMRTRMRTLVRVTGYHAAAQAPIDLMLHRPRLV